MYQPLTAYVENEGLLGAALWTKTLVPGGARGVALKSKLVLISVWAERLGFVREEWIRFRLRTALGMIRSHYWDGELGSKEAIPEQRWFLNVKIAHSAALWRCVYGGASCRLTLYLRKDFCMVLEH